MSVVTFGETMIRFTPLNHSRIEQSNIFSATVGGSEWNTATGLARLGISTKWISALPQNSLGLMIADKTKEQGVDASAILWRKDGRAGIYFAEMGASPRASLIIYDRAGSCISLVQPGDFVWSKILEDATLFHTTGITPALSASCQKVTEEALYTAKKANIPISFDINYRTRLWPPQKAKECLSQILPLVSILFTTSDDLEIVFGIKGEDSEIAQRAAELFNIDLVVVTVREAPTVLRGSWHSVAFHRGKTYQTEPIELELIDRIGSGDAFNAGFLYRYLQGGSVEECLAYGDAMSALKHSIPGDACWVTLQEIESFQKGRITKIQR